MQIFVKSLIGKTISLNFNSYDTIFIVKHKILEETNIPINQQILTFNGKLLENNQTIHYYSIPTGSIIHLVLRLSE